ncbi:MAG TPA: L-threonylcarbamoyladenylate synthase [Flavobacteriales bacterium]
MSIGTAITTAAHHLRNGDIVAIPTETVYGLAANAFDPAAVLKVFEAKQRPSFDPLIVHVRDRMQVEEVVGSFPLEAIALMERFWPGPLTLVLPKTERIPDLVTSGLDTVGVRMPEHPMALELLRALDFPLAAPSANPFGYVSPTTAQHVADQLGDRIPYILDGGPCTVGVESTIVGWEEGRCVLYRPGGLAVEAIEAVIGTVGVAQQQVLPVAPGLLESHYAPRIPVFVGDLEPLMQQHAGKRIATISFRRSHAGTDARVLSPKGELNEAAQRLFAALRELDASDAEVILAEVFPAEGLGRAINDRLRRAAAKG